MATRAAAERPLKEAITTSGVKDSFAMPIINCLLTKGKLLRRATDTRKALSPEDVNGQLFADLMKKKDVTVMNPLLSMPGISDHFSLRGHLIVTDLALMQDLMFTRIRLSNRCIPISLESSNTSGHRQSGFLRRKAASTSSKPGSTLFLAPV